MGRSEDERRTVRAELFWRFESVDSRAGLLDLQLAMIEEIKIAEIALTRDRKSPERDHRHPIRLLGDALAWRLLHPYAIRHLYTGDAAPPNLSNQQGLDATIDMARKVSDKGQPALIADLTYCIGTGDVIACADPERPLIMESGGRPSGSSSSRKGRQRRRRAAHARARSAAGRGKGHCGLGT
jgi:hypothetical protein